MQDMDTKSHDKVNLISHKMNENKLNNEGYLLENPTNQVETKIKMAIINTTKGTRLTHMVIML